MKSLLITGDFPPRSGGMANYYFGIVSKLPPEQVVVLTLRRQGWAEFDRNLAFRVYRTHFRAKRVGGIFRVLLWFLYSIVIVPKERVKVVQCGNMPMAGYVSYALAVVLRRPYLIYFHGMDLMRMVYKGSRGKVKERVFQSIIRRADGFIANSHYTKTLIQRRLGVSPKKITVVHPGVDTEVFRPQAELAQDWPNRYRELHKRFHLNGKPILLSVGRLTRRKGIDKVIEALSRIKQLFPELLYVAVGQGDQTYLKKLAAQNGVEENLRFTGYVDLADLIGLYNLCDLFVMIPREERNGMDVEGFGTVYLEAAACCKPCVAGRSGGVSEAVIHGETGLVVDPLDVESIAVRIIGLLSDPERMRRFGESGMRRVREQFTWEAAGREVAALLEQISKDRKIT